MSDLNEASYYEIALTNRQVVVAFVVLLTLVMAVFLCGVWVGRSGESRLVHADPAAAEGVESAELANMEEFKFFEEQQAQKEAAQEKAAQEKAELNKPDLGRLASKPRPETTLAQDVGANGASPQTAPPQSASPRAAQRTPPPAKPDPEPQKPPAAQQTPPPKPQAQQQTSPPPRAAAPAQAAPVPVPAAENFVVQVFSTHDEPQALKLQGRLQKLRYRAFLSTIDVGGQTMYRVRIGPFVDRGQAEKVKVDVRNQLKLDPWVTAASN